VPGRDRMARCTERRGGGRRERTRRLEKETLLVDTVTCSAFSKLGLVSLFRVA